MRLHFYKMHGCGNDFLFLDGIEDDAVKITPEQVIALCDRNFGIGADGLAVLRPSTKADAQWEFYNCDGGPAEMCGNAARCATLYLTEKYFTEKEWLTIDTAVGVIKGKKIDNCLVEVGLRVIGGTQIQYEEKVLKFKDQALRIYFLNTGVPHAVIETENIRKYPLSEIGRFVVKHPAFGSAGTNVTFFERKSGNEIDTTTFERGVEKETFACGTGVVAASIVYSQLYAQPFPIKANAPGGTLQVDKSDEKDFVQLRGPAQYVMEADWRGELKISPAKRYENQE